MATRATGPAAAIGSVDSETGTSAGAYPAVPLVITGLFCLYMVVWYLEAGLRSSLAAAVRLEFLLGATLTIAAVLTVANREDANRSRLTKYIAVYFLFLFCHMPLARHFPVAWDAFTEHILKFSCMALFIYAFVRNPKTLRIFVLMLLLVFAKVGQEALFGTLTGSMIWQEQGFERLHGAIGSQFGHPSSLSGFAVCTLPLIFELFPIVSRKWKFGLIALAVCEIDIVLFTGSRTGYIALIALLGLWFLRSEKKARALFGVAIVCMLAVFFVPEQYQARFTTAFTGEEAEGHSKDSRIEVAKEAWGIFLMYPQGVGINNFRLARMELLQQPEPVETHNLYLQILTDVGVGGAFVFGLLIAALLRELRSSERAFGATEKRLKENIDALEPGEGTALRRHYDDIRFMRAVAGGFIGYVVARLALGGFGHDLYEIYWWLASGASIALVNMQWFADQRTAELLEQPAAGFDARDAQPPLRNGALASTWRPRTAPASGRQ